MKRNLIVVGTNPLVGHGVEDLYRANLDPSLWAIKGYYEQNFLGMEPPQNSVLVIDRRLAADLCKNQMAWFLGTLFVVPYDEVDFSNIHDSVKYLTSVVQPA